MRQAVRGLNTPDVWFRPPANDNDRGPGDTEADRWRWIISSLKAIHMPAAIQAATLKLEGMSADEFGRLMREAMEDLGWSQAGHAHA